MVLVAVAAAAGDVECALEHLEGHRLDVGRLDGVLVAQRQSGVDDHLAVDQRAVLLEVGLLDGGQERSDGRKSIGWSNSCSRPLGPSKKALGPGDSAAG